MQRGHGRTWALTAVALSAAACSTRPDGPAAFVTAPHLAYPQVPAGGGPVLTSAGLVAVTFSGDAQGSAIAIALSGLAAAGWFPRVLGEYGVESVAYEGQVALDPPSSQAVSDVDLETLLTAEMANGTLPAPSGSTPSFVYVMVVPAGVSVTRLGSDACAGIPGGGYHDSVDGSDPGVPFVVVPSCDPPFSAILSQVAGMELEAARLLADTLTDPAPRSAPAYALTDPSNPWTTVGAEVGDLCWGRLTSSASAPVLQRVWSNQRIASGGDPCVPALPGAVAFGISASPSGQQIVHSQSSFTVEITGWSASPLGPWTVRATPWLGDFPMTLALDADTLANGDSTTLRVSLPDALPAGTVGAILLEADPEASGDQSRDDLPVWPVSFVVR